MTDRPKPLSGLPDVLCTKGIDIREVPGGRFVLFDALNRSGPTFEADTYVALVEAAKRLSDVTPLALEDGSLLFGALEPVGGETIPWTIEASLLSRIPDFYRLWLCGQGDCGAFDRLRASLPVAYTESGFGAGDRDEFERLHAATLRSATSGTGPMTGEALNAFLHHILLTRICDDVRALLSRAAQAYHRLLIVLRYAIRENEIATRHFGTEVQHAGPRSVEFATLATTSVVSAVSAMDVLTRLVIFVNDTQFPLAKFKPHGTSYYNDLHTLGPKALPLEALDRIKASWSQRPLLGALIQYRHDLIHSTAALELERNLFIGCGTFAVKGIPLHYAEVHARDVALSGQPLRFLSREYFTAQRNLFDETLGLWLRDVIAAMATTLSELEAFIDGARSSSSHRLAGT